MTGNPYQKAVSSYNKMRDDNLSPMEIVVELYKGIISNTEQAKSAYEDGQLEEMVRLNTRTFDIIAALRSNLDFEAAPDDAEYLDKFYNVYFIKLVNILTEKDPATTYDWLLDYIRPVYERWVHLAYRGNVQGDGEAFGDHDAQTFDSEE